MEQAKTLEEVARRRDLVQEWILKAREALLSFRRDDGSFWRDSDLAAKAKAAKAEAVKAEAAKAEAAKSVKKELTPLSGTTTARAYMALVYADRCGSKLKPDKYKWREDFATYVKNLDVKWDSAVTLQLDLGSGEKSEIETINHFEVAHLADLAFVRAYIKKYVKEYKQKEIPAPKLEDLSTRLEVYFDKLSPDKDGSGRFPMQEALGPHYFVNLHAARACSILGAKHDWAEKIMAPLRSYCISQCFYAQRGLVHRVDACQLIIAGVTGALYDRNPSVEIYDAIVDATQQLQQPSGNWPATHPIFLKDGKPWHITSHEMALCLSWLYYLPEVTEASRQKLLAMMERYFEQWVVRTYARAVGGRSGWYDDHHIKDGYVVAWATAIVCHFLANYYWILCHEVNRLVLESLEITDSAAHYRFEDTAPEKSRMILPKDVPSKGVALWSDLAPYAWDPDQTWEKIRDEMRKRWTDPSNKERHTHDIASKILAPILDASSARPSKDKCSGILYGPPGTRKTSLVIQVAEALRWPLITVPGSVILSEGWNGLEARATEVFRQLKLLTNCVIFFDEYEEFFRTRGNDQDKAKPAPAHGDNRSIAAFMTSGMLPRLQELHDEQRCLVFLATNFENVLDKAVKRIGRFDFTLEIGHPEAARVLEYIRDIEKVRVDFWKEIVGIAKSDLGVARSAVEAVKKEVTALKEGKDKDRRIPFKWVENALRRCAETPSDAESIARRVLGQELDMDAPPLAEMVE